MLCNYCIAQVAAKPSPTNFDKFITREKIQWAAYANDTIHFDTYNLGDELYKRFQSGDIKISTPISRDSLMAGHKIVYITKSELAQRSFPPGLSPEDMNQKMPPHRTDEKSAAVNVQQILYVANGRLYSYIPWVSTRISIYTSRNQFIGTSEYFSTAINFKYDFKSTKRDKLILIKSTKRKILHDSLPKADRLKEVFGLNLIESIWEGIMNDKNEIIDLKTRQNISLKKALEYQLPTASPFPVYDSLGNYLATQNYQAPLNPSLFQQIEISQDWYYNAKKNIVVNNITDITLFIKGEPYIKILFK